MKKQPTQSATSLPPSPDAERRVRMRKYFIAMGLRLVCFGVGVPGSGLVEAHPDRRRGLPALHRGRSRERRHPNGRVAGRAAGRARARLRPAAHERGRMTTTPDEAARVQLTGELESSAPTCSRAGCSAPRLMGPSTGAIRESTPPSGSRCGRPAMSTSTFLRDYLATRDFPVVVAVVGTAIDRVPDTQAAAR